MIGLRRSLLLSIALALAACDFAPIYQVPEAPTPPAFKEAGDWVLAKPDDSNGTSEWWRIFGDQTLDTLEEQVTEANQSLKIAVAQYDQARAISREARSAFYPSITGNASASRSHASRTVADAPGVKQYNDFTMGADLSYEIDVWGRVRNVVAANEDQEQATADDLAGVALSLHAEMADDYFTLRGDDVAQDILDKTVEADQKALDLTQQRYKGGVSAEVDVDQAETQLENARTQATDMRLQRAQLEHAIAILVGKAPADFSLAAASITAKPPKLSIGIPSTLLQQRPDIAAAERRVAAANAEIGVARAAWFPTFDLMASAGVESASLSKLMSAPSTFWSFGPSVSVPLFEGGLIDAMNDVARAAYNQQVATYRQTVLVAYGEVEDNLAAIHHLEQENKTQAAASAAAERSLMQSNILYKEGDATYLDVVVSQNNALQAELASANLAVRQLIATAELVKALGGSWKKNESAP